MCRMVGLLLVLAMEMDAELSLCMCRVCGSSLAVAAGVSAVWLLMASHIIMPGDPAHLSPK